MRRICRFFPLLVVFLLACRAVTVPFVHLWQTPPGTGEPHERITTPTPALPSRPPSTSEYPAYASLKDALFRVRFHPDDNLYVGDLISMEVIPPPEVDLTDHRVRVQIDEDDNTVIGPVEFSQFGIVGRQQSTMQWEWDTASLQAGIHELTFLILPSGPTWTQTVTLQPTAALPPTQVGAHWMVSESHCCRVHYITGTEAERDLPYLTHLLDEQATSASRLFGTDFTEPLSVVILPRVLGHGGFTNEEISVSYLDRNYVGGQVDIVLHHEMIHLLDSRQGGELRPTLLVEGLAVYLSGGHFKPEPLIPRAAAVLALDWYIPLKQLLVDFYPSQHEIGYLQAGSLVAYMVERWGWEAFSDFYGDIHPDPEEKGQLAALELALLRNFGLTFSQLERDYLEMLRNQKVTAEMVEDLRLTVEFYNTVRRYQRLLDPSAYYQTAWLLDGEEMRKREIVADYLRHPSAPGNVAIETLMVIANYHLRQGNYTETDALIRVVNSTIDIIAQLDSESMQALD
jgi:hypothetical protein